MSDLSYVQRTDEIKIIGQNSTGVGTNAVNADSNGNLLVKEFADGVTAAAVPANAIQVGGSDGTNLRAIKVSTAGVVSVDGSAVTQPVSGTIAPFAALTSAIDGVATLTSTGDNAIIAAQGGLVRIYITSLSASNTSSSGVRIDFKDGATVKHSFYLAPTGGGVSHIFPFPWRLTANTALNVAISGAVTDVRVSATGFSA